ncbi:MAG: glycoside hydrolase family 2 [Chloroflexia bacterium]|nr:glycoside hydrolase family 2 [Chloroflexia bacterium]
MAIGLVPPPTTPMTGSLPIAMGHGYPRPGLERAEWESLNGAWDFAPDEGRWAAPGHVTWDRIILVPFAPETPASGVYEAAMPRACWYRRRFAAPALNPGDRLVLHFGAVDYAATVWVNDVPAGSHEGGFTPFALDVTNHVRIDAAEQTVTVRVEDDPADLGKPIGKQDWQVPVRPGWLPRTTGIWQTVWLERQPATAIATIEWTPDLDRWALGLRITLDGVPREDLRISIQVRIGEGLERTLLVDDTYFLIGPSVERRLRLPETSPGGSREAMTWSPENPVLLRARIRLWALRGELLDEVNSYTAMRDVRTEGDRFFLNGRPYPLRMVIDDGVWSDTGMTPPDDSALHLDVQLIKGLGFNGVFKAQKIEDPRFLYWADAFGLLVWVQLPGLHQVDSRAVSRAISEWAAAIARDRNHPSVIGWIPSDQSVGASRPSADPVGQAYVQALYQVTRAIDPSRPVIALDAVPSPATDILALPGPPGGFTDRRQDDWAGKPIVATGIGHFVMPAHGQEVPVVRTATEAAGELGRDLATAMGEVNASRALAGFCYHRFADMAGDETGLVDIHRTPKLPPVEIARLIHAADGG